MTLMTSNMTSILSIIYFGTLLVITNTTSAWNINGPTQRSPTMRPISPQADYEQQQQQPRVPNTTYHKKNPTHTKDRKEFITHATKGLTTLLLTTTTLPHPSLATPTPSTTNTIAPLFSTTTIKQPSPTLTPPSLRGIDNLYFPPWMEGTWDLTQTLTSTTYPLGSTYLGGPSASPSIATRAVEEQQKQLQKPVSLRLRFVSTPSGVVEDRAYNLRQRLDAFAGRSVVSHVDYADVNNANRKSALERGGTESDPLPTTVVYFKGPAAQKTFMVARGSEDQENRWWGFELSRSIFALTNQSTSPPVTTDMEAIWDLRVVDGEEGKKVEGRLRLASFLNPTDVLYFDAKMRAVSIADYTLDLRRVG